MKIFKGKAISAKALKYLCLGLCVVGFMLLILMKKVMGLPNIACLVTFLVFMIAGLLGYWLVDKRKQKPSNMDDELDKFLKSLTDCLKGGNGLSDSIAEAKESVSSKDFKEALESFLNDSTGLLINSKRRNLLDLIKQSMDGSSNKSLIISLEYGLDKEPSKQVPTLGYVALGSFVVEIVVILICVYLSTSGI